MWFVLSQVDKNYPFDVQIFSTEDEAKAYARDLAKKTNRAAYVAEEKVDFIPTVSVEEKIPTE